LDKRGTGENHRPKTGIKFTKQKAVVQLENSEVQAGIVVDANAAVSGRGW